MFAVNYKGRWLENVPLHEALVFKQEGYEVIRMDLYLTNVKGD